MSKYIYAIGVVQFFLGSIIAALNVLVLGAILANRKLRTAPYLLTGNLWFANLLLGVIVTVANVVDQDKPLALAKAEGTISIMNCVATLATCLSISTTRMVSVKTPNNQMNARSALKIIVLIWGGIFLLILIKSIVNAIDKTGSVEVCYQCLLGFEAALLVIFAITTLLLYGMAIYLINVHRQSTVQDSSGPPSAVNMSKEFRDAITFGILIGVFIISFLLVVVLLGIYTFDQNLDPLATEIVLSLFYTHCIVNPIVFTIRDDEVSITVKRLLCCRRPNPDEQPYHDPPPPYGAMAPNMARNPSAPATVVHSPEVQEQTLEASGPSVQQYGSINTEERSVDSFHGRSSTSNAVPMQYNTTSSSINESEFTVVPLGDQQMFSNV